jgi:hypothetical protein
MNLRKLYTSFQTNKNILEAYIYAIKKKSPSDFYSIINTTLIKNPYESAYPKNFFLGYVGTQSLLILFLKSCIKFYSKQFAFLILYFLNFLIFKLFYRHKQSNFDFSLAIDVFFDIDNIVNTNAFHEKYFDGLYQILDKTSTYCFIPRLYGSKKNILKLIKFFRILSEDQHHFIFEFDLLRWKDFFLLFLLILLYPFKTLRILQDSQNTNAPLFNQELITDIQSTGFDPFSRYIFWKESCSFKKNIKNYLMG